MKSQRFSGQRRSKAAENLSYPDPITLNHRVGGSSPSQPTFCVKMESQQFLGLLRKITYIRKNGNGVLRVKKQQENSSILEAFNEKKESG